MNKYSVVVYSECLYGKLDTNEYVKLDAFMEFHVNQIRISIDASNVFV